LAFHINILSFHSDSSNITSMKKETSNEDRRRIIEAHQSRSDMKSALKLLGVNRTTALGIIKVHKDEGRIDKLPRGRKPKKLADEHRDII
jgi:transposase